MVVGSLLLRPSKEGGAMVQGPSKSYLADKEGARQNFESEGVAFFPKALPTDLVRDVEQELMSFFQAHGHPRESIHDIVIRMNCENPHYLYLVYQALSKSFALAKLRSACQEYIDTCLRPEGLLVDLAPGLLMCVPNDDRIIYDWHQEIVYHRELEDTVHLWLPILNDATLENGTMSALKGSHKLGALPFSKKEKVVPNSTTNLVPHNIDMIKLECPEMFFEATPGDLAVLHSYVVHRSNRNTSPQVRFIASFRVSRLKKAPSTFDFSVK